MPPRSKQDRSKISYEQAMDAALKLFSSQGFGATSMRQIADASGLSMGNLYHHFPNKESIFQQLLDRYFEKLEDPEHPLQQLFAQAHFPEDLERMASVIEGVVRENSASILLIYVDVVEFRGQHIRGFYEGMAKRFQEVYGETLAQRQSTGEIGNVDPLVGVILAARWFFYFFTVEQCFGVPMHFGMNPQQATEEFIRLLRFGLLPRMSEDASGLSEDSSNLTPADPSATPDPPSPS